MFFATMCEPKQRKKFEFPSRIDQSLSPNASLEYEKEYVLRNYQLNFE